MSGIYYVTDSDGRVVGQFKNTDRDIKDGHTRHDVETDVDLPGVDEWDDDYLRS